MSDLKRLEIAKEIIKELHASLAILGAKSDLLCITGSYNDTLSDEEMLEQLRDWNSLKIGIKEISMDPRCEECYRHIAEDCEEIPESDKDLKCFQSIKDNG